MYYISISLVRLRRSTEYQKWHSQWLTFKPGASWTMTFGYEDMREVFTFPVHNCCGPFHSHNVNTLTGPQYWIDQSDPSSDPQSSPGLRSLPVGRRHNTGSEYYQDVGYRSTHHSPQQPRSRVKDTWNCPQGFEPSNGICQGKLISKPFFVSNLHCCYLWRSLNVILVVNVYFELILKFYFH
jgi:hypothetical protein